eukprot:CAMPEP_0116875458 /NCGR_PEP_ID=MMETSP0463-20121206/7425_1 /TAXON_ID=181622 /ORGANISM="Strombidinopsis sp, Strain SopsisLIS2011" /LENGTH=44 /DNA_ID= /DNA_START= /DNA_END= /DNA_ORIENTATION=
MKDEVDEEMRKTFEGFDLDSLREAFPQGESSDEENDPNVANQDK